MAALNLRRELYLLATAGMESCWVAGLAWLLLRYSDASSLGLLWLSVFALYLLAATTARLLEGRRMQRALWLVGALVLLTTTLFVKVNLYPQNSLLDGTLWAQMFDRVTDLSAGLPHEIMVLLLCLFIWLRGLRIPAGHAGAGIVSARFKLGSVLVTAVTLLGGLVNATTGSLVTTYFGLGLLAMALARIEEVAQAEPGGTSPFGLKWVGAIAATFLVAGGIMFVMSRIITLQTVGWLLRLLGIVLVVVYTPIALLLGLLFEYVLNPVIQFILDLLGLAGEMPTRLEPPSLPVLQDESVAPMIGLELQQPLRILFVLALILIPFLLLLRSFRRWRRRQYAADDDVRGTVEGKLGEDLRGFLRDQWRRLQQMAARQPRYSSDRSVRAIYASLLATLAARDRPRRPDQTPYEYEPVAEEVVPLHKANLEALTEAYVRVRYGEGEIGAEELTHLQEAWRRIKEDVASKKEL